MPVKMGMSLSILKHGEFYDMPMPNFLIVGAAKSGTTSLYHYLAQHPQVFMAANKEPHHFAAAKWCGHPPLDRLAYQHLFQGAEGMKAVGEASTGYLYYPESPEWIHSAIPDCRIVIILRNPVERAFSGYCHEVREGVETVSFEAALAEERVGLRIIRGGEFSFNYIKQYIELFGRERVHICLADDLASQPGEVMRNLFNFLGVDEEFEVKPNYRYNPSGIPRFRWLNDLMSGDSGAFGQMLTASATSLIPTSLRHTLWHRIRDWNVRLGPKLVLNKETKKFLQLRFEPEVCALETLLNRDLSSWKN